MLHSSPIDVMETSIMYKNPTMVDINFEPTISHYPKQYIDIELKGCQT